MISTTPLFFSLAFTPSSHYSYPRLEYLAAKDVDHIAVQNDPQTIRNDPQADQVKHGVVSNTRKPGESFIEP